MAENKCLLHAERNLEIYCYNCKLLICSKCLLSHKEHVVVDYEDLYNDLKAQDIKGLFEMLSKNKTAEVSLFTEEIERQYLEQVEIISKGFRDIHDSLHVKEVEMKRELKSYHEENQEIFSKILTKYEYDISNTEKFLSLADPSKSTDKIQIIKSYISLTHSDSTTYVYNTHRIKGLAEAHDSVTKLSLGDTKKIPIRYNSFNQKPEIEKGYPSTLSKEHKSSILILSDDLLSVSYKKLSSMMPGLVRANLPIPATCDIYYFEITLSHIEANDIACIGLCPEKFPTEKHPGWEKLSYGYHSDDGQFFEGGLGTVYGQKFFSGDTVGVCLNRTKKEVFFTKNGVALPEVRVKTWTEILYPCVSLRYGGKIDVNFGQDYFKFDFEKFAKSGDSFKSNFFNFNVSSIFK